MFLSWVRQTDTTERADAQVITSNAERTHCRNQPNVENAVSSTSLALGSQGQKVKTT